MDLEMLERQIGGAYSTSTRSVPFFQRQLRGGLSLLRELPGWKNHRHANECRRPNRRRDDPGMAHENPSRLPVGWHSRIYGRRPSARNVRGPQRLLGVAWFCESRRSRTCFSGTRGWWHGHGPFWRNLLGATFRNADRSIWNSMDDQLLSVAHEQPRHVHHLNTRGGPDEP
jgi:hypothetical protein